MIRVLVVDDSETFRAYVAQILESDPEIAVVGCATTGHQALEMVGQLRPTIVTMDALMPDLDGVEATRAILQAYRVPIIIVSAVASGHHGVRALGEGAVEALAKPSGNEDRKRFETELLRSVKLLSEVPILLRRQTTPAIPSSSRSVVASGVSGLKVLAIGASTGGPGIISALIQALRPDFSSCILIAQHISDGFDRFLVDWWSQSTRRPVQLAASGMPLAPGTVLVAPGHQHLTVKRDKTVECISPAPGDPFVPSIDRLFQSVAVAVGAAAAGLLLSGMGHDGAVGLLALKSAGAITAIQDPSSAVINSMPAHALAIGAAATVLKPEAIEAWVGGITTRAR
jgi:two-component system, chemotaxis family, protein-glutamate methylesterase/glutaminase